MASGFHSLVAVQHYVPSTIDGAPIVASTCPKDTYHRSQGFITGFPY